jgi:hypothetical protein
MRLALEIKQKCNFFWLRGIHRARIDRCCAKCFIGDKFPEVFEGTRNKEKAHVELDIPPDSRVKAYYLCGLSQGWEYKNNTHVAFVPAKGPTVFVENDRIWLEITNARQIDFQGYQPAPEGEFSDEQRSCRNWIFANYLLDNMPL